MAIFSWLFPESWIVVVFVLVGGYFAFQYCYTKYLMQKLGAQEIENVIHDGFYGFRLPFIINKANNEGRIIEFSVKSFLAAPNPQNQTFMNRALGIPIIVTKDPINIKAMLSTQFDDFSLGLRLYQFGPLLGSGIFTSDGEKWKYSRAMLRPQFTKDRISHILDFEPHFLFLKENIDSNNGQYFDIQELFFRFAMDVATDFFFGESVDSLKITTGASKDLENESKFLNAFNKSQKYLSARASLHKLYFLYDGIEFRQNNKIVRAFCSDCVLKVLCATNEEFDQTSGYVFLRELAKHTRDPVVLQDQVLNTLLAGRDTTASLLSFATFELARNEYIWNKLREEILTLLGRTCNTISVTALKNCKYLHAILNETLRIHPGVPRNVRYAIRDTTLPRGGGRDGEFPILVRKGQAVGYFICATHFDEQVYGTDCYIFRPERWFELDITKLGWSYLPFNGGPRICLGQQFALLEASYVLARLAQCYSRIELKTLDYPPKKSVNLTMNLLNGVNICVE